MLRKGEHRLVGRAGGGGGAWGRPGASRSPGHKAIGGKGGVLPRHAPLDRGIYDLTKTEVRVDIEWEDVKGMKSSILRGYPDDWPDVWTAAEAGQGGPRSCPRSCPSSSLPIPTANDGISSSDRVHSMRCGPSNCPSLRPGSAGALSVSVFVVSLPRFAGSFSVHAALLLLDWSARVFRASVLRSLAHVLHAVGWGRRVFICMK